MYFFSLRLGKILLYIIFSFFLSFSSAGIDTAADRNPIEHDTWQMARDFINNLAQEDPSWLNTYIPAEVLLCYDLEGNLKSNIFELFYKDKTGYIEISVSDKKDVLQIQRGYSPIRILEKVLNNFGENLNSLYSDYNNNSSQVISYGGQHYFLHPKISSYYPDIRSNIMRLEDQNEAHIIIDASGKQKLISNSAPGFPDEFDYSWPASTDEISPNGLWMKRQKDWMGGLSPKNVWTSRIINAKRPYTQRKPYQGFIKAKDLVEWNNETKETDVLFSKIFDRKLVLLVDEEGLGAQINSLEPSFHYGLYKSSIKASPKTQSDPEDPKGVCSGFFVYWPGQSDDYFEEIDVEILSREPEYVYFTIWRGRKLFSPKRKTHWKWSKKVMLQDRSDQYFHTFGFKWLPDRVEFYVNDFKSPMCVYRESDDKSAQHIPLNPAYLILNNWTGSDSWSGSNPQEIEMTYVDWIDYIPLENLQKNHALKRN